MINFSIEKTGYKIESIKLKDLYYIMDQVKYEPKTAGVNIVAELSGAPVGKIKKLKSFQFAPLYALIDEMIKYKEVPLKRVLNLNGTEYGFIPFDELTIGELADLEIIKADSRADFLTHEVLSILYRPIIKKKGDEYEVEEYDGARCKRRSNDFLEVDLEVVYGAIFFFHNFHTNFHRSYAKSLGTTEGAGTDEGETIFTKQKLVQYWTEIFYLLAGDDPLKLGEASKCGIHHAFNFLVRKKQQALKELMAASKANFQGTRL